MSTIGIHILHPHCLVKKSSNLGYDTQNLKITHSQLIIKTLKNNPITVS